MKKIIILILALVFILAFVSCDGNPGGTDNSNGSNTTVSSVPAAGTEDSTPDSVTPDSKPASTENSDAPTTPPSSDTPLGPGNDHENPENPENPEKDKITVESVLGSKLDVFDAEDTFGNEGKISTYTEFVNVDVSKVAVNDRYEITKGGIYRIYGTSLNGQIFVKAKDQEVFILLDGVNLTNTGSAPTIYAEDCKKVTIVLAEGSSNYLTDSNINDENGVIRVRSCDLVMDGKGKLTITGNSKHGISNTKNLTINGGEYNITAVGHGIYGKQSLTINGGKYQINSAKSGFKTGDDEVGKEYAGVLTIKSCSAHIRSNTNGLNAYGSVDIENGRIVIEALGKGIAATAGVNIKGGTLVLSTTEDAIKSDLDILVSGKANIKISTYGNGFEANNATVSSDGVIYIITKPKYEKDDEGEYKIQDGKYVLLDGTESSTVTKYKLKECKGFEIKEKLTISTATIGVDSFEDSLNAKNIDLVGGALILSTTKDGMDASEAILSDNNSSITVIKSNKGIKATVSVTINSGTTSIVADTDAIKSDTVTIKGGKHILFEKIEYTNACLLRAGTILSITTTTEPTKVQSYISTISGVIENKNLCVEGELLTATMGDETITVQLPKDYTEKMCFVFSCASGDSCTITIGDNIASETFTK